MSGGRSLTGLVLDERYEIGEPVAVGGSAAVHRARDRRLGRDVAVKVLLDHAMVDPDGARFAEEARTLALLSHPNIVTLLDVGTLADPAVGERPCLVVELVDGDPLSALVREGRAPQPRRLLQELAEALAYAHARGVVHRDVKPSNVLVTADGRPRLVDFGIARLLDQATSHTRTGQLVGSPAYLAPEQLDGSPATPAVDVHALGLVMIEVLTGRSQASGTLAEVLAARARDVEVPTGLAPGWRRLLAEMTARDPQQRPDAAQVASRAIGLEELPWAGEPTEMMTAPLDPPTRLLDAAAPEAPASTRPASTRPGRASAIPRPVLIVLGLLLALVLVAGLVRLTGGDSSQPEPIPLPSGVPDRYRDPLQQLHDAIGGTR